MSIAHLQGAREPQQRGMGMIGVLSSVSSPMGQGQMVIPHPRQLQQHLPTLNIWKACLSL